MQQCHWGLGIPRRAYFFVNANARSSEAAQGDQRATPGQDSDTNPLLLIRLKSLFVRRQPVVKMLIQVIERHAMHVLCIHRDMIAPPSQTVFSFLTEMI
jgi:hypothetical protein